MLKNQELLDFEVDVETGKVCVLDAPDANDPLLSSLGLGDPNRDAAVAATVGSRRLSPNRDDIDAILGAFGARSGIELAFMGHGLSFSDKLWYRAPGSSERWEDINFYDNDWDSDFARQSSRMTTRSSGPARPTFQTSRRRVI